ncbi:MAG: hypothetical protein PUD47_03845 [Bacteroidales bacterium]|nr:hypothetical protein [Bacteroidales bacterium]
MGKIWVVQEGTGGRRNPRRRWRWTEETPEMGEVEEMAEGTHGGGEGERRKARRTEETLEVAAEERNARQSKAPRRRG